MSSLQALVSVNVGWNAAAFVFFARASWAVLSAFFSASVHALFLLRRATLCRRRTAGEKVSLADIVRVDHSILEAVEITKEDRSLY